MHKNPLWIGLLGITLLATLFFGGKAGWQLARFQQLKGHVLGEIEEWQTVKLGKDRFALDATYRYSVGGEEFLEEGRWTEHFLNEWAAQVRQKELECVQVWFNPKNPQVSRLGRPFPFKSCFYALMCTGLLGYFLWLGYSVNRERRLATDEHR